jgi:hypothetical protein
LAAQARHDDLFFGPGRHGAEDGPMGRDRVVARPGTTISGGRREAGPGYGFFTVGNYTVCRGNRCYRRGTVTVLSGSNRYKFSNLNLNSKNEKINKNLQKIVHDL